MATARITKAMEESVVADVCLYGTRDVGAGWLVEMNPAYTLDSTGKTMLGDGEPNAMRGFTEAIYQACHAVRLAMGGMSYGMVRIYEPNGKMMALASVNHPGYFGDLKWSAAPVFAMNLSELVEA